MNYTKALTLCNEVMKQLEDHFDLICEEGQIQHLKNVYKQMTNIKGNIGSLMKDEKNWAHRANKEQLNDGLYKLYSITIGDDPWKDKCYEIIKALYNWEVINNSISRVEKNPNLLPSGDFYNQYRITYGRLMESFNYTEDEIVNLITMYPYLSKIYTGNHSIVTSIGAMMI